MTENFGNTNVNCRLHSLHCIRMEFSDWLKWFTHCSVCRIVNTSVFSLRKRWRSATFHGQWREKTAGGCYEYADTFFNNPQVMLKYNPKSFHFACTTIHSIPSLFVIQRRLWLVVCRRIHACQREEEKAMKDLLLSFQLDS